MKKKILILGATGMAGHVIYYYLKESGKYELFNLVHKGKLTDDSIVCDAWDKTLLKKHIDRINPDIIINAIGALVQESKESPANAIYLNALLPHLLKQMGDDTMAKLIHISTDCVFSGKKGQYAEDDFRDADDIYGRSKAVGEVSKAPHVTLRTSIIGPELKEHGTGLFNWFIHQQGKVFGYTNAIWSGITTLALAQAIEKVIELNLGGLFHITNGISISKFELLQLLNEILSLKLKILPRNIPEVNKSLQRSAKYDFAIPDYRSMLIQMEEWYNKNRY